MTAFWIQTLNGLASASSLFLVAVGLSLIFGVTRIVNFAHGSFYMLGVYVAGSVAMHWGGALGFWGGIVAAGLVVALLGVVIELTVLRRIYRAPELLQLIATFGVVLVIKDAALWIWGPEDVLGPRAPGLEGAVQLLGRAVPSYDLFLIALGVLVWLGLSALLRRTRFGLLLRAATQDREMSDALGVNQRVLFTAVFALGSFLAGLGGALQVPREPASLGMDLAIIADVFVVVVVGGLGSLSGAFVAAVLISLVKAYCIGIGQVTLGGLDFDFSKLTLVAEFLVMAAVLLWRPHGLFGKPLAHPRGATLSEGVLRWPGQGAWQALALGVAALVLLPWWVGDYGLMLAMDVAVFALFAASLGLIIGPGGMGSFGHAAYFGLGAYGVALAVQAGFGFWPSLACGVGLALLAAVVYGALSVRLSGTYMAMLTLALAQITWSVVYQWDAVTGGSNGLIGIWPPAWLQSRVWLYALVVGLCGLGVAACALWVHTPLGYSVRAVRDARVKAMAIGLSPWWAQWATFVFAGTLAGVAGALFVYTKGSVAPEVLAIPRSVDGLVMVLLGGINTVLGPVLGAALFTGLQEVLLRSTEYWRAVLGAVIVLLVVAFPRGVVGSIQAWLAARQEAGR